MNGTACGTEVPITVVATCVAIVSTLFFLWDLNAIVAAAIQEGHFLRASTALLFAGIVIAFTYGNLAYFLSRIGALKRDAAHPHKVKRQASSIYDDPPSLTVLIPSFKEDERVVSQALLSAMLTEYPSKKVVLLIDDAPRPSTDAEARALSRMRELPKRLQQLLRPISRVFHHELSAYLKRRAGYAEGFAEARHLGGLYRRAAAWLEARATEWPVRCHLDSFFVERILLDTARRHRATADHIETVKHLTERELFREYRRLAGLFDAEVSSFERKLFVNLSRESNKAMNLNSYLSLMGKSWKVINQGDRQQLERSHAETADFIVPDSKYVLTLDADSIVLNEYAISLIDIMEAKGNERLAVTQTPYSAIPNALNLLQRTAGATTDIQYFVHQGFTAFRGTYWVGANAIIRKAALDNLEVRRKERGYSVSVYVQDRTLIEDTESSIDLISKGWSLFNYPARLAYSATPADFGSLLIQRRRWANGGLIILPKLIRHLLMARDAKTLAEGFLRIHYLISLATTSAAILLLLLLPLEEGLHTFWLPLAAAPYFFLYGRDLKRARYSWRDLLGVYALNLLLVPVHLGGVLKSLQQGLSGRKTAFGRTPKVTTRTASPPLYIWAIIALLLWSIFSTGMGFYDEHWLRFAFSLANTIVFVFVISSFIGVSACVEDALSRFPSLQSRVLHLLKVGPGIEHIRRTELSEVSFLEGLSHLPEKQLSSSELSYESA